MRLPRAPKVRQQRPVEAGRWRLYARRPGADPVEITFVRGIATTIGQFSETDPFGPEQLALTFPAITIFDALGSGDLTWCGEGTDIDLVWDGSLPDGYPDGGFRWEGYLISVDWSEEGLAVSVIGAMRQLDDFLAKPEYPSKPLTYEWAISRQFEGKPSLRVGRLRLEWPAWWTQAYSPDPTAPSYMQPTGVSPGSYWTGLLTRQTGSWDQVLSSYVNQMLQAMYTDRGRFALDLAPGRNPVLRHRDFKIAPDASTLTVDPVAPGVKLSLSLDWSQSLNAAFGQGTSLSGVAYSGQQVSADGARTTYTPLAALRQVDPVDDKNGWLQKHRMRKEVNLQMQQGLNLNDARQVARNHLTRFADPGIVGTIELTSDVMMGRQVLPRALIRAGMSLYLPQVFGGKGLMLHITKVSTQLDEGTTLTVDSRYRDALTVDEVRLRGRDALSITRSLIGGQYQPPIPDQLVPWDYASGSGYLPSGAEFSSLRLFRDMPDSSLFPFQSWTQTRPPKSPSWRTCYARIGPASPNADQNWAVVSDSTGGNFGLPVKLGQAGSIRLLEIAAYDKDGNIMAVPFHVSFYYMKSVNPQSMPILPVALEAANPPYKGGQHYPFFVGAWETYNADGTRQNPQTPVATETAGLIRAYGNSAEKAGYWPGSSGAGDQPTGLLVDESTWAWDTTNNAAAFDPYSPDKNQVNPLAGTVYMMIYCDQQGAREVFFAGRMFRVEPGVTV